MFWHFILCNFFCSLLRIIQSTYLWKIVAPKSSLSINFQFEQKKTSEWERKRWRTYEQEWKEPIKKKNPNSKRGMNKLVWNSQVVFFFDTHFDYDHQWAEGSFCIVKVQTEIAHFNYYEWYKYRHSSSSLFHSLICTYYK